MFIIEGGADKSLWECRDIDVALVEARNYIEIFLEDSEHIKNEEDPTDENIMVGHIYNKHGKRVGIGYKIHYISADMIYDKFNEMKIRLRGWVTSSKKSIFINLGIDFIHI